MTTLQLFFLALMACAVVFLLISYRRMSQGLERLNTMVQHLSSYAFLIDRNFEVKETNYYYQNPGRPKEGPQMLGNVLRCSVACKEGTCGQGMECKHCPIRFVIDKAFERQDDFSNLEVSMELQNTKSKVKDVDVNIGGRFVSIDGAPHMVINIKDITETKRLLRDYIDQSLKDETNPKVPKLLCATNELARFNHLRELLQGTCRLVYVDKPEQVLHRVGHGKDYGYSALLADEAFLHTYDILPKLNEHIVVIKLSNDGETGLDGRVVTVPDTIRDDELKSIISRYFMK